MKVIIIPGNGNSTPEDNWFPYTERELSQRNIDVINIQFPDTQLARKEIWFPFLEKIGTDDQTILIGHSSGAVAAMRYAETHRILGSVLVAAYDTDFGMDSEKASGYFDDPWDWDATKNNQKWIIQFASTDDPYISIDHARLIHDQLATEYFEFDNFGHFGSDHPNFPELVSAIMKKVN